MNRPLLLTIAISFSFGIIASPWYTTQEALEYFEEYDLPTHILKRTRKKTKCPQTESEYISKSKKQKMHKFEKSDHNVIWFETIHGDAVTQIRDHDYSPGYIEWVKAKKR